MALIPKQLDEVSTEPSPEPILDAGPLGFFQSAHPALYMPVMTWYIALKTAGLLTAVVLTIWIIYGLFLLVAHWLGFLVNSTNFRLISFLFWMLLWITFFWVVTSVIVGFRNPQQAIAAKEQALPFIARYVKPTVREDKYTIGSAQSEQRGNILYRNTLWYEKFFAFFRAIGLLVLLAIPAGIASGLLFLVQFVSGFVGGELAALLIVLIGAAQVGIGLFWFLKSISLGYLNVNNSTDAKKGGTRTDDMIRWALGAREGSRREEDKVMVVYERLQSLGHEDVQSHNNWWVIDAFLPQAFTVGSDLYLTSAAINSEWLAPILAHEMAHLRQKDGLLLSALRNTVYPVVQSRMTNMGGLGKGAFLGEDKEAPQTSVDVVESFGNQARTLFYAAIFGGLGVIVYAREWAEWFRERDYLADDYVIELELGSELLSYLEANKKFSMAAPFSANWTQYTELRIDRVLLSMGQ